MTYIEKRRRSENAMFAAVHLLNVVHLMSYRPIVQHIRYCPSFLSSFHLHVIYTVGYIHRPGTKHLYSMTEYRAGLTTWGPC